MPTLVATYNVRYYWDIPADVVLLPVSVDWKRHGEEGAWYIKWGTLHYCWKQEWKTIEGKEDGFADAHPDDVEFQNV